MVRYIEKSVPKRHSPIPVDSGKPEQTIKTHDNTVHALIPSSPAGNSPTVLYSVSGGTSVGKINEKTGMPEKITPPGIVVCIATAKPEVPVFLRLQWVYQTGLELCDACSGDRDLFFGALKHCAPSILLVDTHLLSLFGPQTLYEIRAILPHAHLVLLWEKETDLPVDDIVINDIKGCLWLFSAPAIYQKMISTVMSGDLWLPRWLMQRIIKIMHGHLVDNKYQQEAAVQAKAELPEMLTLREHEIVAMLRQGLSNKEIGRKLNISDQTVKKHLQHIYAKLGLHRRTQVAVAITAQ